MKTTINVIIEDKLESLMNFKLLIDEAIVRNYKIITKPQSFYGTLYIEYDLKDNTNVSEVMKKLCVDNKHAYIMQKVYNDKGMLESYLTNDMSYNHFLPYILCINPDYPYIYKVFNERLMTAEEIETFLRIIYSDNKSDRHILMKNAIDKGIAYTLKAKEMMIKL